MEQINAYAIRNGKSIEILIKGFLPDTCHTASVIDIYPGGNRAYIIDPGVAQVFIEVNSKPGAEFCLEVLTPWAATVVIPDPDHTEVEIYINNKEKLQIRVENPTDKFVVCGLKGFVGITYTIVREGGCQQGDPFFIAFGPDTYSNCKEDIRSRTRQQRNFF